MAVLNFLAGIIVWAILISLGLGVLMLSYRIWEKAVYMVIQGVELYRDVQRTGRHGKGGR